ncbi:hypothetical protein BgAZ_108180 [Babesia gibsoni]|uniref:Kinase n=1 Tax=Babesia gibsoni TaxID=33632 RepID=A0AAD8UUR6_BABGI|nr:hypothetical protein BgAZ_108180 [Babesia gibsoni]
MAEEHNEGRRELELLDSRHKKLSGTTLMFRDLEHRYIYKIMPEYTTSEATFYAIVNGMPVSYESESLSCLKETLKEPTKLAALNVLPRYYGIVQVVKEEYPPSDTKDSEICKKANYGGLTNDKRIACVKKWQELKTAHKLESSGEGSTKRLYNITASDLDLGDDFKDMPPEHLNALLKSWRQKIVASQTTEEELGFRICSICTSSQKGPLEVSASQAKLLNKEETLSILHEVFDGLPEVRRCMRETIVGVKSWIELQDELSFSATSILVTYDQNNHSRCNIKWVDFTYVESPICSPFAVRPGPSNMVKGLDYLIDICTGPD